MPVASLPFGASDALPRRLSAVRRQSSILSVCPPVRSATASDQTGDVLASTGAAVGFADPFPVSSGYTLIVPRRHVARLEQLESNEWLSVFELVHEIIATISAEADVDGVNVGVNSGPAAGQTVDHAHVHVIPRRIGDVADPRAGSGT